jgi:hypothetical protein
MNRMKAENRLWSYSFKNALKMSKGSRVNISDQTDQTFNQNSRYTQSKSSQNTSGMRLVSLVSLVSSLFWYHKTIYYFLILKDNIEGDFLHRY